MDYAIKNPAQLGAVVKGFRRERKLTQAKVGALVGLAQNAVSEMESDPGRSSVGRLFKLLAALELDLVVRSRRTAKSQADW